MTINKLTDQELEDLLTELEACGIYGRQVRGLAELQQRRAADKNYFMYGIADPDGNPYFDECCVSADQGVIEEEVNALGEGYRVVALYTALPLTDSERAELQEYRKAAAPLTDLERQELIKLRYKDGLRRQQWAQCMQHDPTLGGILPKL